MMTLRKFVIWESCAASQAISYDRTGRRAIGLHGVEAKVAINKLSFGWAGFQMPASHSSSDAQEGKKNLTLLKWKEMKFKNTEIIDLRSPFYHVRNTILVPSILY